MSVAFEHSMLRVWETYALKNEVLHQEAKSRKCKAFLIWHIKWLKLILWPLTQQSVNRAWFELFPLNGAKILQTPVQTIHFPYTQHGMFKRN